MNIFIIPSWFPSDDHPVSGVMIKEQTEAFCKYYPEVNIGISNWAQQDERYLLWSKDHFKNLKKVITSSTFSYAYQLLPNLKVYCKPTFTWSKKIKAGNIKNVIKANLNNLTAFEAEYGPVDVIHAHAAFPAGRIAMEISNKRDVPYCITEHMGPFPFPEILAKQGNLNKVYKQVYKYAAANIAVSPYQASLMKRVGINTRVIPNFINESVFKPSDYKVKPNRKFTFFSLSYIAPNKGTEILIQAAKAVIDDGYDIEFRIGGEGPFSAYCKDLTEQLGIENNILWLGDINRDSVLSEFQNCDAFVLPSQYESMGIVYVEAIACGKPIISTKCGGPETTVTKQNGLLSDKNDSRDLARAIKHLVDRYGCYDSAEIRNDFLRRFSTQAVAPKLLSMYEECMQPNSN
ncbi:glycosyltransferase [Pontibacter oryzae]|nr:glycosyltransferase [Pontibacter oryzae]